MTIPSVFRVVFAGPKFVIMIFIIILIFLLIILSVPKQVNAQLGQERAGEEPIAHWK